eukprot:444344-Pleurochrysis_carterae.AAC.1
MAKNNTLSVRLASREGPQGFPSIAPFATDVNNARLPRFDPEAGRANVMKVINTLKDRFTEAD